MSVHIDPLAVIAFCYVWQSILNCTYNLPSGGISLVTTDNMFFSHNTYWQN